MPAAVVVASHLIATEANPTLTTAATQAVRMGQLRGALVATFASDLTK